MKDNRTKIFNFLNVFIFLIPLFISMTLVSAKIQMLSANANITHLTGNKGTSIAVTKEEYHEIDNNIMLSSGGGRSDNIGIISGSDAATLTIGDLTSVKYISNSNHFLINPQHGINNDSDNEGGTCTTVAMQMLIGYHNYYSDRRLIPETSVNGIRFLDANYGDLTLDPIFQRAAVGDTWVNKVLEQRGCEIIGTQNTVYQGIFDATWISDWEGIGQAVGLVTSGTGDFLKAATQTVKWQLSSGFFSASTARAEIDAGRPIVLGMDQLFQKNFHVVPAYGYAKLDGVNGFLVHYGWGDSRTQVWVPESWFGFQIRMSVNHEHTLVDSGNIINDTHRQLDCTTCGYSTLDNLYNISGSTITDVRYPLTNSITIPASIDIYDQNTASFTTQAITNVGSEAFANQVGITSLVFPRNITSVEANAFKNCTNLTTIQSLNKVQAIGAQAFKGCDSLENILIPYGLTAIGDGAFSGCNNLNITVSSSNPNYSAEGNILYNKNKTKMIASGKITAELNILNNITEIAPHAFDGNSNLVSVRFSNAPVIGANAFNNCMNMNSVYCDSYNVPIMGENSFSNNNFFLYTRHNAQAAYRNIFEKYTSNIVSIQINVAFISNGQTLETKSVYNGSTISNLPIPERTGYEFGGWYSNASFTANPIQNGELWESETNLQAHAKWTPKQYMVTLHASGGTVQGVNTFSVTYDKAYSTAAIASRTGYSFEGWYDIHGVKYMTALGQSTRLWDKSENTILSAKWTIERYEIQINDNGSVVWLGASGLSETSCSIEYGAVLSAINLVPTFKASSHGFKEGRIFDHFKYNNSTVNWESIPDLGANGAIITIEPIWVNEKHTIYFNALSSIVIAPITKEYDQAIALPNISRAGYAFNGWFTSSVGGASVPWLTMPDLTPNEQNNGSTILYAKWVANTYYVFYNNNYGTGNMSYSSHTYDIARSLSLNLFFKTGHDFLGWSTSRSGNVEYINGQNVLNLTTANYANVTLYAVWQAKTYNIIYKNLMDNMLVFTNKYTYGIGVHTMPLIYLESGTYTKPLPTEDFHGWYTTSSFNSKVSSISSFSIGDITLHAKYDYWLSSLSAPSEQTIKYDDVNKNVDFSVGIQLGNYYYNKIEDTTLNKIVIEFSLIIWEVDDGYQDIYLYNGGTPISPTIIIEHGPGKKDSQPRKYSFAIELDIYAYRETNFLSLKFGAHGAFGNTWKFNNFEMSISFINKN